MDYFSTLFEYFPIAVATAIIVYFVGHLSLLFINQEHNNQTKSLSLKLFTGIIVAVSLFAIFKTHGNTICSGLLLLLLFILYYFKISFKKVKLNINFFELKDFMYFLLLLFIFLGIFQFLFGFNHANPDGITDFSYYAAVSNSISTHGIETCDFYINMPGNTLNSFPLFYHYFELWFAALIKSYFPISTFYSIIFVIQPILFALMVLLTKSFIKQSFTISNVLLLAILPFLIILSTSSAEIYNVIIPNAHLHFTTTQLIDYFNVKYSIVYICILFYILNRNQTSFERYLPLGILCLLYPTTFPVIVTGIICLNFYLFLFQRKTISWMNLLFIVSIAFFIVFFYSLQRSGSIFINKQTLSSIILDKILHFSFIDFKRFAGDTFYFYFPYLLYIIPLFVIFKDNSYRRKVVSNNVLLNIALFVLMFSISAVVYCLLFGIPNADQIQKNLFFPVLNIVSFIILILLYEKRRYYLFTLFVLFNLISLGLHIHKICLFNTCNGTSKIEILSKEFSNKKMSSVYIKNTSSYKTYMDRYIDLIIPYPYLRRFTDSYYPECLSIYEMPKSKESLKDWDADNLNNIPSTPFYRFASDTSGKSIDSLKKAFIEKYKVDYLFLEKGNPFSTVVKTLPVEKRISFADEPYEIIKFKWKQQ